MDKRFENRGISQDAKSANKTVSLSARRNVESLHFRDS